MKSFRISRLAEADLDEVWLYVAKDRPHAADELMDRFKQQFTLIRDNPDFGEQRQDLAHDLRQSILGNYVILYRSRHESVEIVRVIHGARDIPREYRRRLFGE